MTLSKLLTIMLFFPSVTFNVLPAEIFPWAILKSALIRIRLCLFDIAVIIMLLVGVINGLAFHDTAHVLSTFASYLNPLLIFICLLKVSKDYCSELILLAQKIFFGLVILGFLQLSGVLNSIESLFDLLLSRGGASTFGGSRGVSLLASEPSRAGVELVFIYALLVTSSDRFGVFVRGSLIQDLFFLAFLATVVRSGTGLAFGLLFIGLRRPVLIIPAVGVVGVVLASLSIDSRAISLGQDLIQQRGLTEFVRVLTVQSGFRVISVVSAYVYAANHVVGYGVGSWASEAVESYRLAGYSVSDTNFFSYYHGGQFVDLKPTAYGALIALELGLLPLIITFIYLWRQIHVMFLRATNTERSLGVIFLLYVFGVGAVGNPVPWICVAVAIGIKR